MAGILQVSSLWYRFNPDKYVAPIGLLGGSAANESGFRMVRSGKNSTDFDPFVKSPLDPGLNLLGVDHPGAVA